MKKLLVMLAVLSGLCFLNTACSDSDDSSSSTGTAVDEGVKYLDSNFNEVAFGESSTSWSKLSDGWKKYYCADDLRKGKGSTIFYPTEMNGGFSVTVKKESGLQGNGYGFLFAFSKETKNYYRVLITANYSTRIYKSTNGSTTALTDWLATKSLKSGYNVENKITVAKENGKYAIYVNDEFVYLIEDSEYTGGYVGFYAFVSEEDTPSTTPVVEYFKFNELNTDNKTVLDGGKNWSGFNSSGETVVQFSNNSTFSKLSNGWTRFSCNKDDKKNTSTTIMYPKTPVTGFTAKLKKESGALGGGYGVVFGVADSSTGYGFVITANGRYLVQKIVGGTSTVLQNFTVSSAIKTGYNQENEISVNKVSGNYELSVNGTKLYTIENPELNDGYVGPIFSVSSTDTPSTTPVVAYCKFTAIN